MKKIFGIMLLSVACIILGLCTEGLRQSEATLAVPPNFPVLGSELLGEP